MLDIFDNFCDNCFSFVQIWGSESIDHGHHQVLVVLAYWNSLVGLTDLVQLANYDSYCVKIDQIVVRLSAEDFGGSVLPHLKLAFLKGLLWICGGSSCSFVDVRCMSIWSIARQARKIRSQSQLSVLVDLQVGRDDGSVYQIVFLMQEMSSPHQFLEVVEALHFSDSASSTVSCVF